MYCCNTRHDVGNVFVIILFHVVMDTVMLSILHSSLYRFNLHCRSFDLRHGSAFNDFTLRFCLYHHEYKLTLLKGEIMCVCL